MYYRKYDDTYVDAPYHEVASSRSDSHNLLANLKQFEHGRSMSAQWEYTLHYPNPPTEHTAPNGRQYTLPGKPERTGHRVYVVYSYATPIATYDPADDTLYRIDYTYSVTTSRQQSLLWGLARQAQYVVDVYPDNGSAASAEGALRRAVAQLAPV